MNQIHWKMITTMDNASQGKSNCRWWFLNAATTSNIADTKAMGYIAPPIGK